MVEFTKTIKDPLGLHARPVALLYDIIAKHRSNVSVSIGDRHTDGRDVMGLMALYGHHLPRFGRRRGFLRHVDQKPLALSMTGRGKGQLFAAPFCFV